MIDFVELKDGSIFNGESPYIFWFRNGQSVNLNYVRKICCISDNPYLIARMDSPVFSLLDTNQLLPYLMNPINPDNWLETINGKQYVDLAMMRTKQFASNGAPYENAYVHMFYILANSQDAGEIHDTFTIQDGQEYHTYEVAADFYSDNEFLKTQLGNFDISIPESIQKAIYEVDVREESNDNIVLNRKYKELLMNYWDIVANKGSYNSLQNSLAWFEWGDLVRIEEVWKRHHEGMEDYFLETLNRELDPDFIRMFLNHSKTTNIGLYLALVKYLYNSNGELQYENDRDAELIGPTYTGITSTVEIGNYVYARVDRTQDPVVITPLENMEELGELILVTETNYDQLIALNFGFSIPPHPIFNESNPVLRQTNAMWQFTDLALKMTLLGNFYSTYFTPIHIDTVHSTLENLIFTIGMKVLCANYQYQFAGFNLGRAFGMILNDRIQMKDCVNYAHPEVMFLNGGTVFGFNGNPVEVQQNDPFFTSGQVFRYPMGGFYGVGHFRIHPDKPILAVDENDVIWEQELHWKNLDSGEYGFIQTNHVIEPVQVNRSGWRASQYAFDFGFDLAFAEPGHYVLDFSFRTSSNNTWVHNMEIKVEDTTGNHLSLFKVKRLDEESRRNFELNNANWQVWLRSFQMSQNHIDRYRRHHTTHLRDMNDYMVYRPYRDHSLFLGPYVDEDSIGLNHTVIFTIPNVNANAKFYMDEVEELVYKMENHSGDPLKALSWWIPDYIWITSPWSLDWDQHDPKNPDGWRVIGINRNYNDVIPRTHILTKIEIDSPQGYPTDFVSAFRFHPCMHQLERFDNTEVPIKSNELVYVEPILKGSKVIEINNWILTNHTTQEQFDSHLHKWRYYPNNDNMGDFGTNKLGGMQAWFAAPQEPVVMNPGYYGIQVNYVKGKTPMKCEINSAFIIGK